MDDTAFSLARRKSGAVSSISLSSTFVHLKDLGQATTVEAGPDFWTALAERADLQTGRLLGTLRVEKDTPQWEMHPAGDELLVALSGEFDLVLQDGRNDHVIELKSGQTSLVPFGVWHRLRVKTPGEIMFVTPSKGTLQRNV